MQLTLVNWNKKMNSKHHVRVSKKNPDTQFSSKRSHLRHTRPSIRKYKNRIHEWCWSLSANRSCHLSVGLTVIEMIILIIVTLVNQKFGTKLEIPWQIYVLHFQADRNSCYHLKISSWHISNSAQLPERRNLFMYCHRLHTMQCSAYTSLLTNDHNGSCPRGIFVLITRTSSTGGREIRALPTITARRVVCAVGCFEVLSGIVPSNWYVWCLTTYFQN